MKYRIRLKATLSLLAFILIAAFPSTSQADPLVFAGFDLFATVQRTGVMPIYHHTGFQPFVGVPLGTFDFGMGPVATFNTDTIVRRLGNATAGSPTVPIELVALQLMSVNQFDLGAGNGFHFITLQSARGGPASLGMITINGLGTEPVGGQPHGTFDSFFDVFFDIRFGSLNGPIVFSGVERISSFGNPWGHFPEPLTLQIPGVNTFLNGVNRQNDFFPLTAGPNGDPCVRVIVENGVTVTHSVCAATVPEPTTIFLLGAGLAGVAAKLRMRSKAKLKD